MTRYQTRKGRRQHMLAVSIAVTFLVSACGGGDDDGGATAASASTEQLAVAATSSATTTDPGVVPPGVVPPRIADVPVQASAPATCNYSPWVRGTIYEAGSIVAYSGILYIANMWNAGSLPTPNAFGWSDWSPYDCATSARVPAPVPAPTPASCIAAPWVQGRVYETSSIVSYLGSLYIARMWNAGSLPTPNANGWSDWSPYDCVTPAPTPASCTAEPWVPGQIYPAGSVVSYQDSPYIAKMWNAGSLPTPNANGWSDWSFFDLRTCTTPG